MDTAQTITPLLTAQRCWVQGRRIYLEINERRSVSFPASKYNALGNASQSELEKIQLTNAGRTIPAIFQRKGELLRICYGLDGTTPTTFATTAGSSHYLAIYRRKK